MASQGLAQSAGAYLLTSGQITTSPSAWLNNIVNNENSDWSSFQMTYPTASDTDNALSAWSAASGDQFQYLSGDPVTTPPIVPSSSAAEISDPAGTYSGAGASMPTTGPATPRPSPPTPPPHPPSHSLASVPFQTPPPPPPPLGTSPLFPPLPPLPPRQPSHLSTNAPPLSLHSTFSHPPSSPPPNSPFLTSPPTRSPPPAKAPTTTGPNHTRPHQPPHPPPPRLPPRTPSPAPRTCSRSPLSRTPPPHAFQSACFATPLVLQPPPLRHSTFPPPPPPSALFPFGSFALASRPYLASALGLTLPVSIFLIHPPRRLLELPPPPFIPAPPPSPAFPARDLLCGGVGRPCRHIQRRGRERGDDRSGGHIQRR